VSILCDVAGRTQQPTSNIAMRTFVAMLIPIFVIFGAARPISESSIEGSYLPRYRVLVANLPPLEAAYIPDWDDFDHPDTVVKVAFFDRRNGVSGSDASFVFPISSQTRGWD
jgi:hypothetical protein